MRRETGSEFIEVKAKERVWRYIIEMTRMEDTRWPKICLREEMRGILNGNPTKWGKTIEESAKKMNCENVIEKIYKGKDVEEISEEIGVGIECLTRKAADKEESRIRASNYSKIYKKLVEEKTDEKYWENKKIGIADKEIWARVRCGNLTKAGKKGERNWKCRKCKDSEESLVHVFTCKKIREKLSKESKKEIESWWSGAEGKEWIEERIVEIFTGKIEIKVCKIAREIENILREAEKVLESKEREKNVG